MKKIIIIILIITLSFSLTVSAEGNIYDKQQDKDWVDSKLDNVINELSEKVELKEYYEIVIEGSVNNQLEQEEQLKEFQAWLILTRDEIDTFKVSIMESEMQYAMKLDHLKKRIVDAYINSGINLLDIIAKASDINDIFEEIEVRKYINKHDQQLMADLVILKIDLEEKRVYAESLAFTYEVAIIDTNTALFNMNQIELIATETVDMSSQDINVLRDRAAVLEAESAALMNEIIELQSKLDYAGGQMIWPLPADRTLPTGGGLYGMRIHPIFGVWKMHTGIDIGSPWDANILAVNDGVVLKAGFSSGYGNRIVIDHGGGFVTLYAHGNTILVKEGEAVTKGQVIMLAGSTGYSTGPHLHFEVFVNAERVDPLLYVVPSR